jgi:hypothetical protein
MNEVYYEAKLLVQNRVKNNAVDIDDVNEFLDECDSIVLQLESDNAELKAQHERDEKEKRVLAGLDRWCCTPKQDCPDGIASGYPGCIDCKLAYAKQEAEK